jgi:phage-related protein
VKRDEDWFRKIQPDIEAFWKDVDGARNGTWKPPPSTRKMKVIPLTSTEATPMCAIQDSGSDKEPTPRTDGGNRP